MESSEIVIVSRHRAAVEWLAEHLGGVVLYSGPDHPASVMIEGRRIPALTSATPDDVTGKIVYGNLPLGLARLAAEVRAIEFAGAPPRGQEYGVEEMVNAGAHISRYRVVRIV